MYKSLTKIDKYCYCGIILLTLSACSQEAAPPESMSSVGEIAAVELYSRIENNRAPLILDVRGSDEFSAGHLPGALNVAHSEFVDYPTESIALLPTAKDAEIVVHCVSGRRAALAAEVMTRAGYTNVSHLSGDFSGWEAAGYPVEKAQENQPN